MAMGAAKNVLTGTQVQTLYCILRVKLRALRFFWLSNNLHRKKVVA